MFTRGSENCINALRIVGDIDDSLAFQLQLQSLLSSTDLSVQGVPPAALVCVRTLPDPLPGTLRWRRNRLDGGDVWAAALNKSLAGKISSAARPAFGGAPNNAECVFFADKAEMLACLARDWHSGLLGTRWWWKTLLRSGDRSTLVKQLWRDHPQYVPAALDQLARYYQALSFVCALTDDECHEMIQQVVRVFALHELFSICATPISLAAEDDGERSLLEAPRVRPDLSQRTFISAPWQSWCSAATGDDLSPERQRFLGIAAVIQRAPAHARSPTFARAVERWQRAVAERLYDDQDGEKAIALARLAEPAEPPAPNSIEPPSVSSTQFETQTARALKEAADVPALGILGDKERRVPDSLLEPSSAAASTNHQSEDSIRAPALLPDSEPLRRTTEVQESVVEIADATPAEAFAAVTLEPGVEPDSVEVETQLGGLFYLINLALYLKLYGDFTMPAEPGIELNIWDFVSLIGEELSGGDLPADPIWLQLTNLAGRDQTEPPGSDFQPADDWRLPPEWLSLFGGDQAWQWSASRKRLRVRHAEGFLILDLPRAGNSRKQLQSEIAPYGMPIQSLSRAAIKEPSPRRSSLRLSPGLGLWLSRLMPYLRARLRLALGVESDHDAAMMLLCGDGRVCVTATHVDIFFRLSELPVQIRFAGLDRDPGWVPAAGRFITFHFD
ncbi:MAG TPA: hypothetical protein VE961_07945 [Pyrinomonadaceae bacterium]|nr:hypothetical protein [Pyrinomonadaceae bacterium]